MYCKYSLDARAFFYVIGFSRQFFSPTNYRPIESLSFAGALNAVNGSLCHVLRLLMVVFYIQNTTDIVVVIY